MKEILLSYTSYLIWANQQFIDVLLKLSTAQLDQEMIASFPNIRKTVHHIYGAESIWNQRLAMAENIVFPDFDIANDFISLLQKWQVESKKLHDFVCKQYDDVALQHEMIYYDLKKNCHKNVVWKTVQHVVNHSAFHRGQLVSMFRELGIDKIPATDFIAWSRSGEK